jgi:hypothetical protein
MAYGKDRKRQKAQPKSDEWRKPGTKKNTKRWCRGKVGIYHVPVLIEEDWYLSMGYRCEERVLAFPWMQIPNTKLRWFCIHQERCVACNKIIRHNLRIEECPSYLDKYGLED